MLLYDQGDGPDGSSGKPLLPRNGRDTPRRHSIAANAYAYASLHIAPAHERRSVGPLFSRPPPGLDSVIAYLLHCCLLSALFHETDPLNPH